MYRAKLITAPANAFRVGGVNGELFGHGKVGRVGLTRYDKSRFLFHSSHLAVFIGFDPEQEGNDFGAGSFVHERFTGHKKMNSA